MGKQRSDEGRSRRRCGRGARGTRGGPCCTPGRPPQRRPRTPRRPRAGRAHLRTHATHSSASQILSRVTRIGSEGREGGCLWRRSGSRRRARWRGTRWRSPACGGRWAARRRRLRPTFRRREGGEGRRCGVRGKGPSEGNGGGSVVRRWPHGRTDGTWEQPRAALPDRDGWRWSRRTVTVFVWTFSVSEECVLDCYSRRVLVTNLLLYRCNKIF